MSFSKLPSGPPGPGGEAPPPMPESATLKGWPPYDTLAKAPPIFDLSKIFRIPPPKELPPITIEIVLLNLLEQLKAVLFAIWAFRKPLLRLCKQIAKLPFTPFTLFFKWRGMIKSSERG